MRTMSKFLNVTIALVVLLALISMGVGPMGADQAPGLSVQESTPGRLLLELNVPEFTLGEGEMDGERVITLTAAGLDGTAAPGRPDLPQLGLLVGLPPSGEWSVRVVTAERETLSLPHSIALVSPPAASLPQDNTFRPRVEQPWAADEELYSASAFSPSLLVSVGESGWLRDLRVVRLELHPFRYHSVRGELEHIRRLVVEVRFEAAALKIASPPLSPPPRARGYQGTVSISDSWGVLLEQAVINYDVARQWRSSRPARMAAPMLNPPAGSPGSLKIELDTDGLYQLSYDELQTAGFGVDGNPAEWHLTVGGQQVAILIEDGGDGVFGSGDRILFYGQAADSRYTAVNVYWLYNAGSPGLRMASRLVQPTAPGAPTPEAYTTTLHVEENYLYDPVHPEANGDHWYWTDLRELQTNCPTQTQTYQFSISHLWEGATTAALRASLQGYTYGEHHLTAWLNDHLLGDIIWQDYDRWEGEFDFDETWLNDGLGQLRLENGDCPTGSPPANGMAFNYFEVDYQVRPVADEHLLDFNSPAGDWEHQLESLAGSDPALFDITDTAAPVHLTGWEFEGDKLVFQDNVDTLHRYLAVGEDAILSPTVALDEPSDLLADVAGADYLLIGYGEFLPATQALVDLRASQGLQVASVEAADVFDEFSFGRLDPQAIRELFLQLSPLPETVLLVGDGTMDFRDYLGLGWHNFVPAYPADVDPWLRETASDNQLACIVGEDMLPDLFIGRLPVTSLEETETVVAKIVGYETTPAGGPWRAGAVFVADDADYAGDFAALSDELYYDFLPAGMRGARVYLEDDAEATRAKLRSRWQAGQLLATFWGHSSHSQWALENLLHRDDSPSLQNGDRLPIVLSLTCYAGAFQHPPYATLDERLLLEPGGGAVAAWGPTGEGVSTGHRFLAQGFLASLADSGQTTLGAATLSGKLAVYNNSPATTYLIDTFSLLGDPAMSFRVGDLYDVYLPLVIR